MTSRHHDLPWPTFGVVTDHLVQRGGAERVLPFLVEAAGGATVHTAFHEPDRCYESVNQLDISVLPVGRSALFRGRHRASAPVLPRAFGALRVDADVVLCATSGWAQGVATDGRKVAYVHAMARWVHSPETYLRAASVPIRATARMARTPLARWDRRTMRTVDRFVTQSRAMRDALRMAYGVETEVVPVPNCLGAGHEMRVDGLDPGFVLYAGRLMPYKHVDLVLATASRMPAVRFVLAGGGPLEAEVRSTAGPNVVVLGDQSDAALRWLYRNAGCLLTLAEEPFGLTPIEAAALGTPTVARAAGGFLDTVVPGVTGLLVDPDARSAAQAVASLLAEPPAASLLREHAEAYSPARFTERMREILHEEAALA